jgi:hypothetical protein
MNTTLQQLLLSFIFYVYTHNLVAGTSITIHPDTGLKGWKFNQDDIELELIQRLPDQTRGFFIARGFSTKIADDIANACIFQTIIRNTGSINNGSPVNVALKNWHIQMNKQKRPIKLKEDWEKAWSTSNVSTAAQLAFRWSTFPSEQTFYPSGDYNWGMISFGVKPGSVFDLYIEWKTNTQTHNALIPNIQCANDR